MGRARRRARRAAAGGALPAGPAGPAAAAAPPAREAGGRAAGAGAADSAGRAPGGDRAQRLSDPEWRQAERRRIARLNRLPDPFRSWGDRSRGHAFAVAVLQVLVAIGLTLPVLRLTAGRWLPPYAAVVALGVAVALQAVCRRINTRADARSA